MQVRHSHQAFSHASYLLFIYTCVVESADNATSIIVGLDINIKLNNKRHILCGLGVGFYGLFLRKHSLKALYLNAFGFAKHMKTAPIKKKLIYVLNIFCVSICIFTFYNARYDVIVHQCPCL